MGVSSVCCKEDTDATIPSKQTPINPDIYEVNDGEFLKIKNGRGEKYIQTSPKKNSTDAMIEELEPDTRDKEKDRGDISQQILIFIEKFEVTYTLIDDFGLDFSPKLTLAIVGSSSLYEKEFETIKDVNGDLTKQYSTNDSEKQEFKDYNSNKINANDYMTTQGNEINTNNIFNANAQINLDEIDGWEYSRLKITLTNVSSNNSNNIPIVIGTSHLNLNQFIDSKQIEGKLEICSKFTKLVGYLYIRVKVEQSQDFVTLTNQSNISFACDPNQSISRPITTDKKIYYQYVVPYNQLTQTFVDMFEIKENEDDVSSLNNKTPEFYAETLVRSIVSRNDLFAYEILYLLNSKFDENNKEFLAKFLAFLGKIKNNSSFFDFPLKSFDNKNFALLKLFYVVIYKILSFLKNESSLEKSEKSETKYSQILDIHKIFEAILVSYDTLNHFIREAIEDHGYVFDEQEELTEINIWILNIIIQFSSFKIFEYKAGECESPFSSTNSLITTKTCMEILKRHKVILETFSLVSQNTEICSSISKIFRKCIMEVLNCVDLKDELAKKLLLDSQTNNSFLLFVELSVTKYIHYPEIFANVLLILVSFSKLRDNEVNRKLLDTIKIVDLCFYFEQYRWKLKNISKTINTFFYEYLANLTDTARTNDINSGINKTELKKVINELCLLYKIRIKDNKFYINRQLKKYLLKKSSSLHENFTQLAYNLSSNAEFCPLLVNDKSYFFPNLIEYFVYDITSEKAKSQSPTKRKNQKDLEYSYHIISKNSLGAFNNIITNNSATRDFFFLTLKLLNINKQMILKSLRNMFEISKSMSDSSKLRTLAEEFTKHIENYMH